MQNRREFFSYACRALLFCAVLSWSSLAAAEPGRGRAELSAEPQRSYGAIDVVMYQTSW